MTQPFANHIRNTDSHPEVSAESDDVLHCSWGLYVALRGVSRGLLLDPNESACSKVATHYLELLYMTVYPPSDTPLPFCDNHRAAVVRDFEGGVPNYRLRAEEVIEVRNEIGDGGRA